jgi:uncharacterized protein (DUF927 family)
MPKVPKLPRQRTAADIANAETIEMLALKILAATIGAKLLVDMSGLFDELLQFHDLDDSDEEGGDTWLDDQNTREKRMLDEAVEESLNNYRTFAAVKELKSTPDIASHAEQLRAVLAKCDIGATRFDERFMRAHIERMVKSDLKKRFEDNPKYSKHVRNDVPGSDVRSYGPRGRTSSKGTFAKISRYDEEGGRLDALLTGGWLRVAKDRIEPTAWSHRYGLHRKTDKQAWRHHFLIIERNGSQSPFELARELLVGHGSGAIKALTRAGVHVVRRKAVANALVNFLGFRPKREIIRMTRVGWASIGAHLIFVRPDEVLAPKNMPAARLTGYVLDGSTRHGLHISGTTAEWKNEIAKPLADNSNIALSFATFFAAPLLMFASEPGGGFHFHGVSKIGKSMASDVGQSIYGWPHELAHDAFGVSWGGTEAGFDALALARSDLGLPLDEITLADRRVAEQIIYKIASGTKGPRATSTGHLREGAHASLLVVSTGEKSLPVFIGPQLQEGAKNRLVDIPAEVSPGSAFETISRGQIHVASKPLFDSMKRQHGAVGRDWQRYLVDLGPAAIKADLNRHRDAFLALAETVCIADRAHPQVRVVINRFALWAAALRMAIEAGLLPWNIAQADAGIAACMERWVGQRGNIDTAGELLRVGDRVQAELFAGLDRFVRIIKVGKGWAPATKADAAKQKAGNFDGYLKSDCVLVRPQAWHKYANGAEPAELAAHFRDRGLLIADADGKLSRSERVMGQPGRFYILKLPEHATPATPATPFLKRTETH